MLRQLRKGPGEGWSQRSVLFDIIRCSGMSGDRRLHPTATHLVVENLDEYTEKLHAARQCAPTSLLLHQHLAVPRTRSLCRD